MKEKDTNKLLHSLKKTDNFQKALSKTKEYQIDSTLVDMLNEWLTIKQLTKSHVLKNAGIAEATGYQYFDGKRKPSRKKLIALTIGLHLTIEETNDLLKKNNYAQLYPKRLWDAIVIFGISHHLTLTEIDDLLFDEGLKTFSY